LGAVWLAPSIILPRQQTERPFITIVVEGAIEQASYAGRARSERGTLIIRPSFDCRQVRAAPTGAKLFSFAWRQDFTHGATYESVDVDRLVTIGAVSAKALDREVEAIVMRQGPAAVMTRHWSDELAGALVENIDLSISNWSKTVGISRETVARRFHRNYGVGAARFRLELRARAAWKRIVSTSTPLSLIALESGFADQAHMTRTIGWFTGRTPSACRAVTKLPPEGVPAGSFRHAA
jgi:AraC-like DNA-binding protein